MSNLTKAINRVERRLDASIFQQGGMSLSKAYFPLRLVLAVLAKIGGAL